jgi:uncharacterized Zn-binding protein involved in type VI secretion
MQTPGTPPIPHVGGPILPPGCVTVFLDGLPSARVGDQALCVGPPDSIVRGAFPALVGGQPAARQGDSTAHGGVIALGTPKVLIGAAGTSGNPWVGNSTCQAAASGRSSGSTQQSYGNCGVESVRQVANQATGGSVGEDQLLNLALNNGWAGQSTDPVHRGGTGPADREAILSSQGVSSVREPQNMQNIERAVAEGRGVITSHDAGTLWNTSDTGGHAVVVTGVEYDADGNPVNVIINDTGTGQCRQSVPAQRFQNSLRPNREINVTARPIW